MMGYIKHFDGQHGDWVDSKNNEPVNDKDVRACCEKDTLAHAGVRLIGE
jgi:3-oxoacyl-ACP reductase-like protein